MRESYVGFEGSAGSIPWPAFFNARGAPPLRAFVLAARLARGWLVATTCSAGGPDGKCRSPIAIAPAILRHAPIRCVRDSSRPYYCCDVHRSRSRSGRRGLQPVLGNAVALDWTVPREPDARGRRARAACRSRSTSASVNGGVWKTTDYGRTWTPIFDDQPTGSIGAIAVAPSDPERDLRRQRRRAAAARSLHRRRHLQVDRRRQTWTHLGLRDGQQIPQIVVDPQQPEPAVRRGARPPVRAERRARRLPLDRRRRDVPEGALQGREHRRQSTSPSIPRTRDIVYAALWAARQGPWENGGWTGTGGGIFKSTDGGTTWQQLTQGTARTDGDRLGRIGIAIAPSDPDAALRHRRCATASGGIYRSDDAGESWTQITQRQRVRRAGSAAATSPRSDGRSEEPGHRVSSPAPSSWKSTDGGKTWTRLQGRARRRRLPARLDQPGQPRHHAAGQRPGRGRHRERRRDVELLVQPADGADVPRHHRQRVSRTRVCGGQQESGSACVASRGNDGADHVPRLASGRRRGVRLRRARSARSRHRLRRQGDALRPADRPGAERRARTPVRGAELSHAAHRAASSFSPVDPHMLFFAANVLWKTDRRRQSWEQISPDLTRKTWRCRRASASTRDAGRTKPTQRGVIYTVAPSLHGRQPHLGRHRRRPDPRDARRRRDLEGRHAAGARRRGARCRSSTPAGSTPRPRTPPSTRSGSTTCGRTSTARTTAARRGRRSSTGIPDGAPVNAVREDPKRKGLLFAGTERAVYVSFDDGETLAVAAAEHAGDVDPRPHRQGRRPGRRHARPRLLDSRRHHAAAPDRRSHAGRDASSSRRPRSACRWNMNTDTPLPPEEPAGQNPPDGAIIDYYLKASDIRSGHIDYQTAGRAACCGGTRAPIPSPRFRILRARPGRSTGYRPLTRSRRRRACIAFSGTFTCNHSGPAPRPAAALAPCRRSCRFRRFPITLRPLPQPPGPRRGPTRSI